MSQDFVVLAAREPSRTDQEVAFDSWPEPLTTTPDSTGWLVEVTTGRGEIRLQCSEMGFIDDLTDLDYLGLDITSVVPAAGVWMFEITVPAAAAEQGTLLAHHLATTITTRHHGIWIDRQTGQATGPDGPLDLPELDTAPDTPTKSIDLDFTATSTLAFDAGFVAALMGLLAEQLPAAYPHRYGWDDPYRKRPPTTPDPNPETWKPWLEQGGAGWDGNDKEIWGSLNPIADVDAGGRSWLAGTSTHLYTSTTPADLTLVRGFVDLVKALAARTSLHWGSVQAYRPEPDGWHGTGAGMYLKPVSKTWAVSPNLILGRVTPVVPEMGWGVLWGPCFIDAIGADRFQALTNSGVLHDSDWITSPTGQHTVWTQLTAHPLDIITNYTHYSQVRDHAKTILGDTVFLREDWAHEDPRYTHITIPNGYPPASSSDTTR